MDWALGFENVNYVAVLVAALSTFVVGAIWYAPSVAGNEWMKQVGLKKKDMESREGMAQIFLLQGALSLVKAYFLAALLFLLGGNGWVDGAILGAVVGLVFDVTSMGSHLLFEKKTFRLFTLNTIHDVLSYVVMGAVIGGFGF